MDGPVTYFIVNFGEHSVDGPLSYFIVTLGGEADRRPDNESGIGKRP